MGGANGSLDFDLVELQSLHGEIRTRILIQNGSIILTAPICLISGIAMLAWPIAGVLIAAITCVSIAICALVWCHNGVRQAQIKKFLIILARRYSDSGGWELWLPNDRAPGLLGNRWFISTKGVFMGAQIIVIALGFKIGEQYSIESVLFSFATHLSTIWLLLTNPKESVSQ